MFSGLDAARALERGDYGNPGLKLLQPAPELYGEAVDWADQALASLQPG